jgi:hypothetical protein
MPGRMMWVSWEDGAELSSSRKSPGDHSPLTRDAENRLGHVVLSDIDDDDEPGAGASPLGPSDHYEYSHPGEDRRSSVSDVVAEVLAKVAAEHLDDVVEAVKPHVARWWNDQARPAIRSAATTTRNRFRRAASRAADDGQPSPCEEATTGDSTTEMKTAGEGVTVLTTVEAEQRLTAALVARAFSDEQIRTVLDARVVDAEQREVQLSVKEVSRDEIQVQVNRLLAANPAMLASLIELVADTQPSSASALQQPSRVLDLPPSAQPEQGDPQTPPLR